MRVLLTDDSKTIRMVLRDVLTQLGHSDVHEAENGAKALEMVANGGFEVILLDLHMPVLDGLGTLKQLKADAKTAHIPVVIISSDTDMRVISWGPSGTSRNHSSPKRCKKPWLSPWKPNAVRRQTH